MTDSRRSIAVVTGTRAEYGLLKSSMRSIRDDDDLVLQVIATGMHLSPRHGHTVDEIRDDGFTVDREVLMQLDGDTGASMAKSLGTGICGLTDAFHSLDPDIVLVLGDRDEALSGALAAAHMNIPVAHVHGGDAMRGAIIDDSIRHAITKFAHVHFPASQLSAQRLRKMGEEPWRITVAGAPGLDDILRGAYESPESVLSKHDIPRDEPLVLALQHPLTTQPDVAGEQMATTLDALERVDGQVALIYPNSDAGSDRMIEEIESRSFDDRFHLFRSLPREEYLGLMATADVMVGNSSSGIIEAPSFDLPVVNVGPRQDGRERPEYIVDVPHRRDRIEAALDRCLHDPTVKEHAERASNPYDFGGAGKTICQHLSEIDLTASLLEKKLAFELSDSTHE